jgi:hypothetical protein
MSVAFAYCTVRDHLVLQQLSRCLIRYVCNMILKKVRKKEKSSTMMHYASRLVVRRDAVKLC